MVETIVARVITAIDQRLPAPTTNGGWLDSEAASAHLGMSKEALRAATRRGHITAHRTSSGRLTYKIADLDRYAMAGDR